MKARSLLVLGLLLPVQPAAAQEPAPDLWLLELHYRTGAPTVGAPTNLTRRAGYDNQPWFLPDGNALLYVAEHDGQTDVYRYDLASGERAQVTRTPQWREYSPTLAAGGTELRVVRWDRAIEQGALWRYSAAGEPQAPIQGAVPQVGYYAFPDSTTLALFINDEPRSFVIADTRSGRADTVTTGIAGSAPQRIPGTSAVSVLTRDEGGEGWITRFEPQTGTFRRLVRAVPGQTQYAWTRRGTVLMGHGSTLYEWNPNRAPGWLLVATLPGLRNISRIAVSPTDDRIVLVAEPEGREAR